MFFRYELEFFLLVINMIFNSFSFVIWIIHQIDYLYIYKILLYLWFDFFIDALMVDDCPERKK